MKTILAYCAVALALFASAADAGTTKWQTLEGCIYVEHPFNDGDSFHVRQGDREYIFRLYFVDTPENDESLNERVREQAVYFGASPASIGSIGREAAEFVRAQLSQPFTVATRWHSAQGRSKMPRHYAMIRVNGRDLGEMLVEKGLARVYGVRVNTPEGSSATTWRARLLAAEDEARHARRGAWSTSSQLDVALARREAARTEDKVIMAPRTVVTYTPDLPRRRMGEIARDTHVHILEEYRDGWVHVAYDDASGTEVHALCLRWDLSLPDLVPEDRASALAPVAQ